MSRVEKGGQNLGITQVCQTRTRSEQVPAIRSQPAGCLMGWHQGGVLQPSTASRGGASPGRPARFRAPW